MRKKLPSSQRRVVSLLEKNRASTIRILNGMSDVLIGFRNETKSSFDRNIQKTKSILRLLRAELLKHYQFEEKILFPFAKSHLPKLEPMIHFLEAEHRNFKENTKQLSDLLNHSAKVKTNGKSGAWIQKINEAGAYFIYLLRHHLEVRCEGIDKVIDHELRGYEKKELVNRFKHLKH